MSATTLSVIIIVLAIFLAVLGKPILGMIALFISALIFIRGNRLKRERIEQARHQETIEAMRKQ